MAATTILAEQRFTKQFNKLVSLYKKHRTFDTLELYRSDARTPLFMLESLCRIYRKLYPDAVFEEQLIYYKKLEDGFGQIDAYDVFAKGATNARAKKYFLHKRKQAELALKAKYIQARKNTAISVLRQHQNELKQIKWMKAEEETKAIRDLIKKQFVKIKKRIKCGELHFNDIESGVHEVRRKLRWIGMYTMSLNGLIQVRPSAKQYKKFNKYKITSILQSSFNKLPQNERIKKPLLFDEDNFFALSWIIAELGAIKDKGLTMKENNKALGKRITTTQRKKEAVALKRAKTITLQFFKDFDADKFLR